MAPPPKTRPKSKPEPVKKKKKKVKESKTLQKLKKAEEIVKGPKKEAPRRWRSWLHRYVFPRKYLVLMVFSGLLGLVKHRVTRDLIFTALGRYFPMSRDFIGHLQIYFETAHDVKEGKTMTLGDSIKDLPTAIVTHKAGLAIGNPRNVVINKESTRLAESLGSFCKSFIPFGLGRCARMAADAAKEITDDDEMKRLLSVNILDSNHIGRFRKYKPTDGRVFTGEKARQLSLFWAVKSCQLEDVIAGSKSTPKMVETAKQFLEFIGEGIIPRLKD
jgi:hypothetical protein